MRWWLETQRQARAWHVVATPLDDDARQEDLWPTHPRPLCGRQRRRLAIHGTCEDCMLALAGLDAYSDVVARWENQGRQLIEERKEDEDGDNEGAGGSCPAASVRAA